MGKAVERNARKGAALADGRVGEKLSGIELAETERARIAHRLHAGLTQDLSAASLTMCLLSEQLEEEGSPHRSAAAKMIERLERTKRELRDLVRLLGPVPDEGADLGRSLSELASDLSRDLGLRCECTVPRGTPALLDSGPARASTLLLARDAVAVAIARLVPEHLAIRLDEPPELALWVRARGRTRSEADADLELTRITYRLVELRATALGARCTSTLDEAPDERVIQIHWPRIEAAPRS